MRVGRTADCHQGQFGPEHRMTRWAKCGALGSNVAPGYAATADTLARMASGVLLALMLCVGLMLAVAAAHTRCLFL